MSVGQSVRRLACSYRKSARFAVFIILLASFAIPAVLASSSGSLNLSPNVNVNANSPFGCGLPFFPSTGSYQASGGVSVSGTYSGSVYLTGSITIYGHDKATDKPETQTLTLTQGDFSPNPMNFPSQSQSGVNNPQVNSNFCQPVIDGYTYWVAASNQPGCTSSSCLLANSTVTVSVTGGSSQMFQLIMEMPLFNETTLGTTIYCAPTTAPCGLPLQGFYDFIFIIAIIIAGGGFLVALANKEISGDERQNVVLDFVLAVLFILLFPVIYNNIALLTNYLDMTIVAGPNFPYTDYGIQISLVWAKLLAWAQGGSVWGMLVSPITTLAGWIVALVVYLMSIFLGVVRIWLVTVTVIGFPISLALKQVPFARKLSSMVEDTLYGLILASLLSSVAIGVAAYVLADAPGGPVWSATIFAGTGINGISNWVAASALFTAILLPTVFAPLTGTLFQTASQASMVGVGVAVSMAGAGAAPAVGAAGAGLAGMGGVGGLGKGMSGAVGQAPQTMGQASGEHDAEHGARGEASLRGPSFAEEHGRRRDHRSPGGDGGEQRGQVDSDGRAFEQLRHRFSWDRAGQCDKTRDGAGVETSTALQGANQTIGTLVFNAATAHTADADFLTAQAPALNRWYVQQSQVAPAQFLSQARQNRIISVQQYQALARDPRAQAEFAEAYKLQLNAISERDALGNLTPEGLGRAANLRSGIENAQARPPGAALTRKQALS